MCCTCMPTWNRLDAHPIMGHGASREKKKKKVSVGGGGEERGVRATSRVKENRIAAWTHFPQSRTDKSLFCSSARTLRRGGMLRGQPPRGCLGSGLKVLNNIHPVFRRSAQQRLETRRRNLQWRRIINSSCLSSALFGSKPRNRIYSNKWIARQIIKQLLHWLIVGIVILNMLSANEKI